MELGNQIKALRLHRGLTQEALAEQLNISPQAVSKWERGESLPDIGLLPHLSVCLGVTIDELFSLSDETRMERIENMIYDERVLDPAVVERERAFLLEKARREPDSGLPYELLAELENHLADEHHALAAEYAKAALEREPARKDPHNELVFALGGKLADWCSANHRELIRWYQDFTRKHPDVRSGYLWLLDQLIDDGRLDEARDCLDRMEQVDGTFRTPLYRGNIAWAAGDHGEAMTIWEKMCADFPDEWCVWLSMGDVMAKTGQYEKAKGYYRRSFELQAPPRFCDALSSIAQVCELAGDTPGAVAALEEEMVLLSEEWHISTGEMVDKVRREIGRLKAL